METIMKRTLKYTIALLSICLILSCAATIDLSTLDNKTDSSYSNLIGCYDMYSMFFNDAELKNEKLNFDTSTNKYYIEILDNDWFLNWKAKGGNLIDCRRGKWGIKDSTIYFNYLQQVSMINKDTIIWKNNVYWANWKLKKATENAVIVNANFNLHKCKPIENEFIIKCKQSFPE